MTIKEEIAKQIYGGDFNNLWSSSPLSAFKERLIVEKGNIEMARNGEQPGRWENEQD